MGSCIRETCYCYSQACDRVERCAVISELLLQDGEIIFLERTPRGFRRVSQIGINDCLCGTKNMLGPVAGILANPVWQRGSVRRTVTVHGVAIAFDISKSLLRHCDTYGHGLQFMYQPPLTLIVWPVM